MLEKKRGLCQGKKKNQAHDAPDLERHPGRGCGVAPDRFIDGRECQKEKAPAPGQSSPAFFREIESLIENIFYEKAVEAQSNQQDHAEDRIENSDLHFDEGVVVQIECQAAEDHDQDGGDQWNG